MMRSALDAIIAAIPPADMCEAYRNCA